jgi:hypothetical protein
LTNWPALDVAIGLSFTFFVLSLVCTSLNEVLATVFNWRAKTLERWIGTVLSDPSQLESLIPQIQSVLNDLQLPADTEQNVTSILTDASASVKNLESSLRVQLHAAGIDGSARDDLVSKLLAARDASLAATTQPGSPKSLREKQRAAATDFFNHPAVASLVKQPRWGPESLPITGPRQGRRPSYVPASTFATYLLQNATGGSSVDASLSEIMARLPGAIRVAASDLVAQVPGSAAGGAAATELAALRSRIEQWYDQSMQRVSGWYKRHVQLVLAIIALLVAGALNADTIQIANSLWTNTTLRSAIVANAGRAVANPSTVPTSAQVKAQLDQVHALNLPLGWGRAGKGSWNEPTSARLWASKIGGILITVFALMLGAPFWFDLLGRFVQIRASGDKPVSAATQDASASA